MKNYISSGDVITVTAATDVESGDLVVDGALVGFAQRAVEAGSDCAIVTAGVYTVAVASADEIHVGDVIYVKDGALTTDQEGAVRAGIAVTGGVPSDGQADVQVKINA